MNKDQHPNFVGIHGELTYQLPLARYTSWRVGGSADCFYRPADLVDLQNFIAQLPAAEPITFLGLGSNVLIRDKGIAGTVILTLGCLDQISQNEEIVRAEAGVTCSKLAKFAANMGYEDAAFFAGIPGTVGGALVMNAGAFGGETWRDVVAIETLDRHGVIRKRDPKEFSVAYREVKGLNNDFFVAGYFRFSKGDMVQAKQRIRELLNKRNDSQPIGTFSCGSVFRNPPSDYAARLIESCGLKGKSIGHARVSEKHANFILNDGEASAQDIEALIYKVRDEVEKSRGIKLETEVKIIGRVGS